MHEQTPFFDNRKNLKYQRISQPKSLLLPVNKKNYQRIIFLLNTTKQNKNLSAAAKVNNNQQTT